MHNKRRCHAIIHSHAAVAAMGNAIPVPGLGVAVDMLLISSMSASLCLVLRGNLAERTGRALALATVKNTLLAQPIKTVSKELSKVVPGLGQAVAPGVSLLMLEAAGWSLVNELTAE